MYGRLQSLCVVIAGHVRHRTRAIDEDFEGEPTCPVVDATVNFHGVWISGTSDGECDAGLLHDGFQVRRVIDPDANDLKALVLVFLVEVFEVWKLQNADRSEGGKISQ